jgi:hypothetical protein
MEYTPVAEAGAGTLIDSGFSGLMDALNVWGKVEEIKAAKSASGGDQRQAVYMPELPNGAAVALDSSLPAPLKKPVFEINKPILFASVGLLAIALIMNRKGF